MTADEQLFLFLNDLCSREPIAGFFSLVTGLGNALVLIALIVPLMYFFSREKFRRHFVSMAISVAVCALVVVGVKIAVNRPRPPAHFPPLGIEIHTPLGEPVDKSFPSGHTQTAFGAATYLSFVYPLWSPVFLLLATLVGVSRIVVGVHFPADVIAGAFIGALFSAAGYWINEKRLKRRGTT